MSRAYVLFALLVLSCGPAGSQRSKSNAKIESPLAADRQSTLVESDGGVHRQRASAVSEDGSLPGGVLSPVIVRSGGCTISVGAIISFEMFRGGYQSDKWISGLSSKQAEMARGEDHFEAHGRCVLAVQVGDVSKRYLHIVNGFVMQGPEPTQAQCLADRASIAKHLMVMTDRCTDATGRGQLADSR